MLRCFDFRCPECSHEYEDLVEANSKESTCPKCGATATSVISTPGLATYSLMSPEGKRESLLRRSKEHTKKEVAKNGIPQYEKRRR